jgi:hypothetical protein
MKKQYIYFFLMSITILLFYSLGIQTGIAYPGDGDCQDGHSITYIDIPIDNSANIVMDGLANEEFWSKPENQKGNLIIPLASIRMDSNPPDLLIYMNATFIMNANYLYILCEWEDNSTDPEEYYTDALLFCWSINVVNFSAYYPSSMSTEHRGGGRVDSWKWYHHTSISSGVPSLCNDDCFEDNGWVDPNPELSQVYAAFIHVQDESYTVEIRRALTTNEEYDVQFNEKKDYLFNVAIYDNDLHENHAMSWTYSLDLTEETAPTPLIPGYSISLVVFNLNIIGIILILQINRKKKYKQKIK